MLLQILASGSDDGASFDLSELDALSLKLA
jgi:hypothetical protein